MNIVTLYTIYSLMFSMYSLVFIEQHGVVVSEGCDFVLSVYLSEHVNIKAYKYQIYNEIKTFFCLVGLFSK